MALICIVPAFFVLGGFQKAPQESSEISGKAAVTIDLPIIMYHNILKSRTGKYVVSPKQLEADFIALNEKGYTTVFMSQVIDWVDGKGTLPEKPVVITFDDGHYNNLHYGLEIAKKHNIKFMINPVTSFSKFTTDTGDHSNPNYSHITWEQMKQAVESGHIEFGNHTHAMHKFTPRFGVEQVSGESFEDYANVFKKDINRAQELLTSSGVPEPKTFAYPFGKYSRQSRELLVDMGFRALLTCNEKNNKIVQGDPTTLHSLGRYNRAGGISTEKLLKKIS